MLERLALRARILAVHVATHSRSRTLISWSYVHVLTADYHSPFLWLSHSTRSWWSFVVTSVTSVSLLFTTVFPFDFASLGPGYHASCSKLQIHLFSRSVQALCHFRGSAVHPAPLEGSHRPHRKQVARASTHGLGEAAVVPKR